MDIRGISGGSMPVLTEGMSQKGVMGAVSTKLLDMSLNNFSAQAESLTKMMEMSVNPAVGGNIDLSV